MDFTESEEHALLRESVAKVARSFGHEYFQERSRTGGKTEELWQAVAELGFLGVHLPVGVRDHHRPKMLALDRTATGRLDKQNGVHAQQRRTALSRWAMARPDG